MANPSMGSSPGVPQQVHRLEKNVLSVPNGIALAAAAMAPVIAVVLNAPAAGPVAGAALPLSFLLAFIACLLVGNSIVQFARHLPSAGSFYTFNSYRLGKTAGFFTGWRDSRSGYARLGSSCRRAERNIAALAAHWRRLPRSLRGAARRGLHADT